MFCHKCAAQAIEGAKSCASCGATLFQAPDDGGAQLAQERGSKGQAVACQAENESDAPIKDLRHRRSIVLWVALLVTACGLVVGHGAFLLGLAPIPYALWVHRKLQVELARVELAKLTAQGGLPQKDQIMQVVISRGAIAALLIVLHDPMTTGLLAIMAGIAFVMAVSGKPAATRTRFAKAAIYGVAAMAIYFYVSHDRSQGDMLVSKLEEYKRQHGAYPERLDALVPELLPEIPKLGLIGFMYARQEGANSYSLMYRPSTVGPCSYTPERGKWSCQAR